MPSSATPLWQPTPEAVAKSNMTAFMEFVHERHRVDVPDYKSLHRWSVEHLEDFWTAVWDFGGVIAETRGARVLADADKMPGARFFPDAKLNYAENLLRDRGDSDAIVFWGEDKVRRHLTRADLHDQVSRTQQALAAAGVGEGDRVAAFLPNMPDSVVAMLATASLGATFTSCSPDFGVQGVLDRFGQVEPKVLFCCDGYFENGKTVETLTRIAEIVQHLPTVQRVVVVPYVSEEPDASIIDRGVTLAKFVEPHPVKAVAYKRMPFNHPLYILYSSGTSGVPKCIVHGAGGVLLMHLKELLLHCDVKAGDRVFYFTTCGWMMWNWLVSGLACGATLLLYDGSPFMGRGNILFDFAAAEGMTHFGTSAKFIDAVAKVKVEPRKSHRLPDLRVILSTGSPLAPEGFDYVYERVKKDVRLASISGGTDLVACFVGGAPILPVWRGEIQCALLGMKIEIFDDAGKPMARGKKGELVCTAPFPSMPLGFWNDPQGARYRAAYFERYPGVWRHGDWCQVTEHDGLIIYGRSDAVLNPGGVRIGTAEIYRQVEKLDEVVESIVIGQDWEKDVRVVLFVRLREGMELDKALAKRIRSVIRANTTPRHVPGVILQVADIPRTRSNKIVELAVRAVVHGEPVKNAEALANPERPLRRGRACGSGASVHQAEPATDLRSMRCVQRALRGLGFVEEGRRWGAHRGQWRANRRVAVRAPRRQLAAPLMRRPATSDLAATSPTDNGLPWCENRKKPVHQPALRRSSWVLVWDSAQLSPDDPGFFDLLSCTAGKVCTPLDPAKDIWRRFRSTTSASGGEAEQFHCSQSSRRRGRLAH